MRKSLYLTREPAINAILVAVISNNQSTSQTQEYLNELAFLAKTMHIEVYTSFSQRLYKIDPKTFVGGGKLEEILLYVEENHIDMIIFDDELSSSHIRNLERCLKNCLVIDRTLLILQIFMQRAKTSQSKIQVELAQYQYMLPRLTNLWTHHSRQKGGIAMKGPGETELETDKRIIRNKISVLKKKLQKIAQQSYIRRNTRRKIPKVCLVGYTNAGKSTLMQLLSKNNSFIKNELFATIDSTVRRIQWKNTVFLLADTVGFIRKLPTLLIESFHSTLSEIREADLLLHIVDISHRNFTEHIEVVDQTLKEIGVADKLTLLIFNKIDAYITSFHNAYLSTEEPNINTKEHAISIENWKEYYFSLRKDSVFISARRDKNIDSLKEAISEKVNQIYSDYYL